LLYCTIGGCNAFFFFLAKQPNNRKVPNSTKLKLAQITGPISDLHPVKVEKYYSATMPVFYVL